MGLNPHFASSVAVGLAQVSTANTNRDGSGTLVDVVTGAASGTRIEEIIIRATETTTAGMVRLFLYDESNNRLWKEQVVTAITVGADTEAFSASLYNEDGRPLMLLPPSWVLKASTHNAETFNIVAIGGDF